MKIALINGSPKITGSASGIILDGLKQFLGSDKTIQEFSLRTPSPDSQKLSKIIACDVLVFSFPLYVDGLPSHLISSLMALEAVFLKEQFRQQTIYAIANCGFYEGHQNKTALRIIKNWCSRTGLRWGQGLGIGAGGMLSELANVPMKHGTKASVGNELEKMAARILEGSQFENVFTTANFPRFAYKAAAEYGWRKAVKSIGLDAKDLGRQHYP